MTNHPHKMGDRNPSDTTGLPDTLTESFGLKRRHFMGTALALDAATLLAACGGGGGGGGASGAGSSSGSSSGSSNASGSASNSSSASGSSSGSSSGSGVPTAWAVSTIAGTGTQGVTNGATATATINASYGLCVDNGGTVFFSESGNQAYIRKISTSGVVSVLAGSGRLTDIPGAPQTPPTPFADGTGATANFNTPYGLALDNSGNLFVADDTNHRIRKITPDGVVSTLAGPGSVAYIDGTGGAAGFNHPSGIAFDKNNGNFFVADSLNNRIRKVTPDGVVTTFAGSTAGSADGTGTGASFKSPSGIAIDQNSNLYVADLGNKLIRKITPAAVVSTLAGTAGTVGFADGTGATAMFAYLVSLAVDGSGYVYVADSDNHCIRRVSPGGMVTTVAGTSGAAAFLEGTGTSARFNKPIGIAIDNYGNLYVTDLNNRRIRKLSPI